MAGYENVEIETILGGEHFHTSAISAFINGKTPSTAASDPGSTKEKLICNWRMMNEIAGRSMKTENKSTAIYGKNTLCSRLYYQKTGGAATTLGQKYEYGLSALVYLRLLMSNTTFLVGCNVAGLGAFDDMFVKLGTGAAYCIQLKHKEFANEITTAALIDKKGKFSLHKYYQSYCDIEKMVKDKKNLEDSDVIREIDFDNFNFILYTNSPVEHLSVNKAKDELCEVENILSTGNANQAIFSFNSQDKNVWKLLGTSNTSSRDHYHKFLSKLKIFSSQCSASEVLKLVEHEVANCAHVGSKEARILSSNFLVHMEEWWNKEEYFLTEGSALWYALLRDQMNSKETHKLEEIIYRFQPDKIRHMNRRMERDMFLNVVVTDVDEDIRCLKLWTQVQKEFGEQYLVISSCDVINRYEQVESICKNRFCEALIINMRSKSHLQIILNYLEPEFTKIEPEFTEIMLITDSKLQHPKCHVIDDTWHIGDLIQESQERILESIIEFQGYSVVLSKLCDHNMMLEALNGKCLATLMKGIQLTLGRPLAAVDDLYIPRTLFHQTVLNPQILHVSYNNDIFAVSHFPHQEAIEICPGTVILSRRQHSSALHLDCKRYEELCEKWKEIKNIHWVAFVGDFLTWKQSCGSSETVLKYLDVMSSTCQNNWYSCYHVDKLADDWKTKLRLVTGLPGMGKSTLLRYLAVSEKRSQPHAWVLLVPLNSCTSFLDKISPEHITLDQVVDMLLTTVGDDSFSPQLSKKLLLYSLKHTGNLSLFLDAIDEISPTYKLHVMNIIKLLLQDTKLHKLWVSSRTVLEKYLEVNLSSLPLVLQPFTNTQQVDYLKKYLMQQGIGHDADNIANHLTQQYRSVEQHLYSVPLHARLAADMFIKLHEQSPASAIENKNFINMNLHEMYDNFFIMKHDIYYRKYNLDQTSAAIIDYKEEKFKIFMNKHITCALLVIFSDEQLKQLNIANVENVQQFLQDIEKERIGIIESVCDSKPHFVHISFAEYLVALWFKQKFEENNVVSSDENIGGVFVILHKFIREIYRYVSAMFMKSINMYRLMLDWEIDSIRLLFDHMVAGTCELHQAVLRGDLKHVNKLLESGLCVDSIDSGGRIALHLAASYGKAEMAKLLLKFGSTSDASDNILNWHPLRYADYVKAWDVVVILLRYEIKETDIPHLKYEVPQKLIRESIKAAAQADNEDTSRIFNFIGFDFSQYNARYTLYLAIAAGDIQLVQKLIQQKDTFKTSIPALEHHTPLHEAAECGQKEAAILLLNHEADVNAKDGLGCIPLHISSRKGNVGIVCLLLERGSDVGAVDNFGCTAMHLAALKGHYDVVQMLLERNAPVEAKDASQWTPLLRAAWQGHFDIVKLLLEQGGNIEARDDSLKTALHRAAWEGQVEAVKILIENGADIEARDRWNITPLLEAASEGHSNIVHLLLKKGADREASSARNRTALHRAAFTGHLAVVQVLLDCEADIEAKDESGRTALHLAASKGHSDVVQLLLLRGSNPESRDNLEWTALHRAAFYGHLNIVRILIDSGANLEARDNSGDSPLEIAIKHRQLAVVRMLKESGVEHVG